MVNGDDFPKNGPVILACNHPTAFLEPCILACFLDRPLYFIVRGDFFKNPFLRRLMFGVHLIPIHRREGGLSKIKKNREIFNFCYDALDSENAILIMAEGTTRQHKRLGPLKKGTGRLAIGFMDSTKREDAVVSPVGVNFSRADHWRTDVSVQVGENISVQSFKEALEVHPNHAFEALNDVLRDALSDTLVYISDPTDDSNIEFLLHFIRVQYVNSIFPHVVKKPKLFFQQKRLAKEFSDQRSFILPEITRIRSELEKAEIEYEWLDLSLNRVQNFLILVTLIPFTILGLLTSGVSYFIASYIAKNKVAQLEFKLPIRAAAFLGSNIIFWPLGILVALYLQSIPLLIIYLFKPLWIFLAFKFYDRCKLQEQSIKFHRSHLDAKELKLRIDKILSQLL